MRSLRIGLLSAAILAILAPLPAAASCLAPPEGQTEEQVFQQQVAGAKVIFVGTVVRLSNGDRTAGVKVEAVWKGPGLPAEVLVRGGPEGQNAATSVDRAFEQGKRYIFFPDNDGPPFTDNSCSATQEFTAQLAGFRPAAAQDTPGKEPSSSNASAWLLAGGIAVILGGLAGVAVVYRRSH